MDKVLIDSSAWIEFFRKKEPYYSTILELVDNDRVCCIGIIFAELLQGAKSEKELNTIKEFLHVFDFLPEPIESWRKAGELAYTLKRKGKAVGLSDCYIGILTKSNNIRLITLDRHFDILKKEIGLQLYNL
ncbi:MAG: PIN domain-containing protein [Nitrospirae bacterium]|nr:PIN domain-containing protein [Nitrospirota bacterium]